MLVMKKFFAYIFCFYFLVVSLLPNSKVCELLKMANLVSHFTHHQVVHKENINFWKFLALHYLDKEHQSLDYQEHENLPFQSSGQQNLTIAPFIFITPTPFCWAFDWIEDSMIDKSKTTYQEPHFFAYHLSIWQPPKFIV
jgi:hypothetical protein